LISSVVLNIVKDLFSPFLSCFLRGTQGQGAGAPAVAFAEEPKKSRLLRLIFMGGLQPVGPELGGSQACVREAHGYSPAYRAREKAVPEKGRGLFRFLRVDLQSDLGRSSLYFW
jgi:hypothetical protein